MITRKNLLQLAWDRFEPTGKTRQVISRIRAVGRLFKTKHYADPDELFFTFEDLPLMGKEYWFLYFLVPGTKQQTVLTFGRADDGVRVNQTSVDKAGERESDSWMSEEGPTAKKSLPCAAVCWMHDRQKKVLIDSHAQVTLERAGGKGVDAPVGRGNTARRPGGLEINRLVASSGPKHRVVVEGKYPEYDIRLVDDGKTIFSAHAHPPKAGMPYEIVNLMRTPIVSRFGAVMVNYYFEFEGRMNSKPLAGKAYLQKVVAVMPLAPWNWVRLEFAGGATFDFFAAKPLGNGKRELHFACNDFLEINGRRIKTGQLTLSSWLNGDKRRWLLAGKDFYLAMESFAMQPFVMKQKMTFRYDEYLVVVRDFAMKAEGKTYCLDKLGAGSGIVEEASGYLI